MARTDRSALTAELGKKLAALRTTAGLTQVEAAKQLGVSQPEIAKMELGTRRLTYLDAVDLTRLYGATISDLLPSDYLDVHAAPSTAERTRSRAR